MHAIYLVAVKKKENEEKPVNLKSIVQNVLDENYFASDYGFWSNPKADWYVIGGRWSGFLSYTKNGFMDKVNEVLEEYKKKENSSHINDNNLKANEKFLQKTWEDLGGEKEHPYKRDSYRANYEDDAMLLDRDLYNSLLKLDWQPEVAILYDNSYIEDEVNLKDFLKDENVIDNYYLVVIDYHS